MSEENRKAREAAWEAGLTRYTISTPCKRGHFAPRFTSNGGCTQCVNRKPMTANGVRVPMSLVLPTSRALTPAQRVALTNYLARCCKAYHESVGTEMPLHPSALQWAEANGRPWTEFQA